MRTHFWFFSVAFALLVHLPLFYCYPTYTHSRDVTSELSDAAQQFYHMVVDPATGNLFIGALNRIHKLTADLEHSVSEVTGPEDDHQQCGAPPRPCENTRVPTDNFNKLLVLDDNRLITCGSIYQGACQVRRLDDLTMIANSTQEIAPNTVNGTVVAFVAPSSVPNQKVLFVGASKGKWLEFGVPTISSRQLPTNSSDGTLLGIVKNEEQIGTISKQLFPQEDANNPTGFKIEYIHGFSHDGFSYFIANQPEEVESLATPENYTKIVQICQADRSYYSYIELPLNCMHPSTDEKYNLAQAAHVAHISSAEGLQGFEDNEAVLFVTFSKAIQNTMLPSDESAVCMYPMRMIRQMFFDRRLSCFQGDTEKTDIMWWNELRCPVHDLPTLVSPLTAWQRNHQSIPCDIFFKT